MTADRASRLMLIAWGLVFAAGGAAIVAIGAGAGGSALAAQPVLTPAHWAFITGHRTWAWAIIVTVGVILAALGTWWLITQLRTSTVRRLRIDPDRGAGGTVMPARLLTAAVTADLDGTPGVERGDAQLVRRHGQPELQLRARLNAYADIPTARRHIETVVIPRARQALAPQPLPAQVTLEIAAPHPPRQS